LGPDFRNTGGPLTPFDFVGSALSGITQDAFFAPTTKNNPYGIPGGSKPRCSRSARSACQLLRFPSCHVALMLGGFRLIGAVARGREWHSHTTSN
jgi:hypothetical protein